MRKTYSYSRTSQFWDLCRELSLSKVAILTWGRMLAKADERGWVENYAQSLIAQDIGTDKANVSRAIKLLESHGLIRHDHHHVKGVKMEVSSYKMASFQTSQTILNKAMNKKAQVVDLTPHSSCQFDNAQVVDPTTTYRRTADQQLVDRLLQFNPRMKTRLQRLQPGTIELMSKSLLKISKTPCQSQGDARRMANDVIVKFADAFETWYLHGLSDEEVWRGIETTCEWLHARGTDRPRKTSDLYSKIIDWVDLALVWKKQRDEVESNPNIIPVGMAL